MHLLQAVPSKGRQQGVPQQSVAGPANAAHMQGSKLPVATLRAGAGVSLSTGGATASNPKIPASAVDKVSPVGTTSAAPPPVVAAMPATAAIAAGSVTKEGLPQTAAAFLSKADSLAATPAVVAPPAAQRSVRQRREQHSHTAVSAGSSPLGSAAIEPATSSSTAALGAVKVSSRHVGADTAAASNQATVAVSAAPATAAHAAPSQTSTPAGGLSAVASSVARRLRPQTTAADLAGASPDPRAAGQPSSLKSVASERVSGVKPQVMLPSLVPIVKLIKVHNHAPCTIRLAAASTRCLVVFERLTSLHLCAMQSSLRVSLQFVDLVLNKLAIVV